MNAPKFWMVIPALLVAGTVGMVYAKLPTPPMDDAAKAAAEAKKAKAAEVAKKDAENLTKALHVHCEMRLDFSQVPSS